MRNTDLQRELGMRGNIEGSRLKKAERNGIINGNAEQRQKREGIPDEVCEKIRCRLFGKTRASYFERLNFRKMQKSKRLLRKMLNSNRRD